MNEASKRSSLAMTISICVEEVPGSSLKRFQIFDTPGLDDPNGYDSRNLARIFSALSEIDQLHLIVLMDSHYVPMIPPKNRPSKPTLTSLRTSDAL
jgi:hypothetical protein